MRKTVTVVILNDAHTHILLHKREDFRVWSLPGGRVEIGESWPQAAYREALEETGYPLKITRLVGLYQLVDRPFLTKKLNHVCVGYPCGAPTSYGWETVAIRWFPVHSLPFSLNQFMRDYIADALQCRPTLIHGQKQRPLYLAVTIKSLLTLRNLRNRLLGYP